MTKKPEPKKEKGSKSEAVSKKLSSPAEDTFEYWDTDAMENASPLSIDRESLGKAKSKQQKLLDKDETDD